MRTGDTIQRKTGGMHSLIIDMDRHGRPTVRELVSGRVKFITRPEYWQVVKREKNEDKMHSRHCQD